MAELKKRLVKSVKNWRLWIFGTVILLGSLLGYLQSLGIQTGHSGDMLCGGSTMCQGEFWIDVPGSVTNYLGETVNITQLCFGKDLKIIFTQPEKINNLGIYKADRRYRSDNPARWKKFNFTGNCINVGNNSFMINATKDKYSTVKWAVEGTEIDPYWLGIEEELSPNVIGDIQQSNQIIIERQDYIDSYFGWNFIEVNDTVWFAEITINKTFLADLRDALPYADSNVRWTNLKDKYFPDYTKTKIIADLKNLTSYPLKNLTSEIQFSKFQLNLTEGTGSFYMKFPKGFKASEQAELGFGTTQINTGQNTGCTPDKRCICNSNTQKFVVYRYNTTHIVLANTTLSGTNGWTLNQTFYVGTTVYDPVISCSGDNVTVGIPDYNLDDFIVQNSLNNGLTWARYTPVTASVNQDEMSIFTRGHKIYGLWWNDSADKYTGFFVISNVDGSDIIAKKTIQTITTGTGTDGWMQMIVRGVADGTEDVSFCFFDPDNSDIFWMNSTNGGTTWGAVVTVQAGTYTYCSITDNTTHYFIDYSSTSAQAVEWSTNGAAWTAYTMNDPTGNEIEGSITLNNLNKPVVFTTNSQYYTNQDLAFSSLSSETTFGSYNYTTNDSASSRYANVKQFFDNNKMEWFWRRNNTALNTYQIWYDYLSYSGEPNVLGVPFIFNTSTAMNCSVTYNGANSGRIDFIWYKNGALQNYNGSSANVNNLTQVYTNVTATISFGNWTCSARAYNTSAYSSWVNSSILISPDISPPTYSSNSTNSTLAGTPINHSLYWQDNNALSGYVFKFCNGTWNGASCLTALQKRKPINVTLSTGSINDTYHTRQNITYDSDMAADFSDLRFFNSTDNGFYECYIVNKSNSAWAVIDIRVNETPINTTNRTMIWMHYKNSSFITSASNGDKTYFAFSDLESGTKDSGYDEWVRDYGAGTLSVVSPSVFGTYGLKLVADANTHISKNLTINQSSRNRSLVMEMWYNLSVITTGEHTYIGLANWTPGSPTFSNLPLLLVYTTANIWQACTGSWVDTGIPLSANTWNRVLLFVNQSGYLQYINVSNSSWSWQTQCLNLLNTINNVTCKAVVKASRTDYFDNCIVRSWNNPEPTYTIGAEEDYILSISGDMVSDAFVSMTGAGNWSNVTKVVNSTVNAWIAWCVDANDTNNNWNRSSCSNPFSYNTTSGADNPPTFSSYNANTTIAGAKVNFSIIISDDTSLSGYVFETNNTGTWVNYTWTPLASGGTAYNITTLNAAAGTRVNISFYANDSLNQWSVYKNGLTTTAADTCTYGGSGQWQIDCHDNCTISPTTISGDLRIYSTGTGNVSMTNVTVQGDLYENYTHSCYVYWYGFRNITGGR